MTGFNRNTGLYSFLCDDCPRRCHAERSKDRGTGFCRCPSMPHLVRAAPHFGEEPCISGRNGSGAVFFSGCNLRCVFCQNHTISRSPSGKPVDIPSLQRIMLQLQEDGVHNINLVTPSHHTRIIAAALEGISLGIPVVWNSSGYESVETLRMLDGLVQIYLPDYKYPDSDSARRYSAAPDYPDVAAAAIEEMFRQRGGFRMDEDGILQSGVMIRHLILPGHEEQAMDAIDFAADTFPEGSILFSLMSQYTPMSDFKRLPELNKRVSPEANEILCHYMQTRHLTGYWQEPGSATEEMIPVFDGTGIPEAMAGTHDQNKKTERSSTGC